MKIRIDNQGYITDFCFMGDIPDSIEVNDIPIEQQEFFLQEFAAYKFTDGKLILDKNKLSEINAESKKSTIRKQREIECFPVINRGQLWYKNLTESQMEELNQWYSDWLNAPSTLKIPNIPEWINSVTNN